MAMVFFMNIYAVIKEIVQISQQVTSVHLMKSSQILKITEKLSQSYDTVNTTASTSEDRRVCLFVPFPSCT